MDRANMPRQLIQNSLLRNLALMRVDGGEEVGDHADVGGDADTCDEKPGDQLMAATILM